MSSDIALQQLLTDLSGQLPEGANVSEEAGRLILRAEQNHVAKTDQIRQVIQHMKDDGVLQIGQDGEILKPDDDRHTGVIIGLEVALHLIGTFPLQFRDPDDSEDD